MADHQSAVQFFGVIDSNGSSPAVPGIQAIVFRDLAAVVAPAEYRRLVMDDSTMAEYFRVVDGLYQSGPIIPAPPGTIFKSEGILRHWLELHYAKLHETLGLIERRQSPTPPYDFVSMQFGD